VVAYLGTLKAGATVSVLNPQYPAERQKILLDLACPKFFINLRRASEEFGELAETVDKFATKHLSIKATIRALRLHDDGQLHGCDIHGVDCLQPQISLRQDLPGVTVGPDSIPTLGFTSGTEGRPKAVQGRHFSLTYYAPWMAERFGLSEIDRFSMLSGIAHDPVQVRRVEYKRGKHLT
jgi:L-aminoadipate-semialdehyde dehydrogenase